eukprot:CAMPEP_0201500318 /NCGR_PEP_ID=MMETSP0151_2-20130828/80867_1 /ASSEMBLY_ACC=CAM_ASM_000257 /TAXON_ID=200890 /ORGANISM="Paramoeba atlantica, Strain 621/1 / CCAP 1560/9" /LENGTH=31 /DNA_ID= /DNA_START= /DNA_END= /DNA_ORIENTATION=
MDHEVPGIPQMEVSEQKIDKMQQNLSIPQKK